jgi:hypothetical protein
MGEEFNMTGTASDHTGEGPGVSPRLSDRILYALNLALQQEDIPICELLVRALELAMTRSTGGPDFVERRGFPPEMEEAFDQLARIKAERG